MLDFVVLRFFSFPVEFSPHLALRAAHHEGARFAPEHFNGCRRDRPWLAGGKGGGGRPDFAQAGGIEVNKIDEAFEKLKALI